MINQLLLVRYVNNLYSIKTDGPFHANKAQILTLEMRPIIKKQEEILKQLYCHSTIIAVENNLF